MIEFGHGKYAMCMRSDGHDVIDIYTLEHEGGKTYDEIMQIGATFFDTYADAVPDMKNGYFDLPFAYYGDFSAFNTLAPYCKATINSDVYYLFVDRVEAINTEATRFFFSIDWWATWYKSANVTKPLYTLKQAYVNRDNKHVNLLPKDARMPIYIHVGEGKESAIAYDLQELEERVHYTHADSGDDFYVKYIRFTFTEKSVSVIVPATGSTTEETYKLSLRPDNTGLSNGLYYAFVPVIFKPNSFTNSVYVRAFKNGSTTPVWSSFIDAYNERVGSIIRAFGSEKSCVGVDLIAEAPFVSNVNEWTDSGEGTEHFDVTFSALDDYGNEQLAWQLETPTPVFTYATNGGNNYKAYTITMHPVGVSALNDANKFPSNTCFFEGANKENYAHSKERANVLIEPKLAQPQYARMTFTDYQGAELTLAPYQTGITPYNTGTMVQTARPLLCVNALNASIYKRKFFLYDYAGDKEGKYFKGISNNISAYPQVSDALKNYLDANKNTMKTGLAIAKQNLEFNGIVQGISGILGVIGNAQRNDMGGMLTAAGRTFTSLASNRLSYEQTLQMHEAQIADLKEQADNVKAQGNNADFDFADDAGKIFLEKWRVSQRDRKRLVEYFHRNGYAVGEYQRDVSLDTMYYFDYIQATDIDFYVTTKDTDDVGRKMWNKSCDDYMRALFARGVRIWHGRKATGSATPNAIQIFNTPYLNTAKEY